eukprot:g21891.t1
MQFLRTAFGSTRDDSTPRRDTDGIDVARPEAIGRFRLAEQLGAGSFGIVYRAFDTVLKRDVALKLPRLLTTLSDNLLERFLRESEAAGRLHHPHIVPVFEAGSADSTAYIAAQYCPGVTLKDWLQRRDTPADPGAAAGLLLRLADAVEHAHQLGILHRDLKPGNVLLSSEGSDCASSDVEILQSAKITDFGLARFLDEETATVTGEMVGTLAYMAPEQARGDQAAIGPECDIYSLGVILYELLTGQRPHSGEHQLELLRRISEERPASPRRLHAGIPRDLESICLKCLEKKPSHRYRTAAELQHDLRRFLDGQATLARPLSVIEQMTRAARRHPGWTAVAFGVLLAGFATIAAVTYHSQRLAQSAAEAGRNQRIAEERQQEVSELLYVANMRVGLHALQQGNRKTFQQQMDKYRHRPGLRGVEWDFLQATLPKHEHEVAAHAGPIYSSAVSPNGKLLATVGQDRVVRLWNLHSRELHAELRGHTDEVNDVAFHPDGTRLASSSDDRTVRLWDLKTGKASRVLPHTGAVYGVAFSPDGQFLASGGKGKTVRLWSGDGEPRGELKPMKHQIDQLLFAPDGVLGVVCDDYVYLWNIAEGSLITIVVESLSGHRKRKILDFVGQRQRMSTFFEFSPGNDGLLISTAVDGVVRYWDVERGTQLKRFDIECDNEPIILGFSNDGRFLAHAGGAEVVIKDVATWRTVVKWTPISTRGRPNSIAFSPDNRFLALANPDHTIELRDTIAGKITTVLSGHEDMVNSVVFSKNGRTIFSASIDGTVRAWHVASGQEIGVLFRDDVHIRMLRLSSDGRQLLAGHSNGGRVGNRSGLLYWQVKPAAENSK